MASSSWRAKLASATLAAQQAAQQATATAIESAEAVGNAEGTARLAEKLAGARQAASGAASGAAAAVANAEGAARLAEKLAEAKQATAAAASEAAAALAEARDAAELQAHLALGDELVHATFGDGCVGLVLGCASEQPPCPKYIVSIDPNGLAARIRGLQLGQTLVKVDGHEVELLPFSSCLRLIEDAWRPMTLTFVRVPTHLGRAAAGLARQPAIEPEPEPELEPGMQLDERTSLSLSAGSKAMVEHHKHAQLEQIRNSIIATKRRMAKEAAATEGTRDVEHTQSAEVGYREWLRRSMPGDYDNEFVAQSRQNETLHELWAATTAEDKLSDTYTALTTTNSGSTNSCISVSRIETQVAATVAQGRPDSANTVPAPRQTEDGNSTEFQDLEARLLALESRAGPKKDVAMNQDQDCKDAAVQELQNEAPVSRPSVELLKSLRANTHQSAASSPSAPTDAARNDDADNDHAPEPSPVVPAPLVRPSSFRNSGNSFDGVAVRNPEHEATKTREQTQAASSYTPSKSDAVLVAEPEQSDGQLSDLGTKPSCVGSAGTVTTTTAAGDRKALTAFIQNNQEALDEIVSFLRSQSGAGTGPIGMSAKIRIDSRLRMWEQQGFALSAPVMSLLQSRSTLGSLTADRVSEGLTDTDAQIVTAMLRVSSGEMSWEDLLVPSLPPSIDEVEVVSDVENEAAGAAAATADDDDHDAPAPDSRGQVCSEDEFDSSTVAKIVDMGFSVEIAKRGLRENSYVLGRALAWIIDHQSDHDGRGTAVGEPSTHDQPHSTEASLVASELLQQQSNGEGTSAAILDVQSLQADVTTALDALAGAQVSDGGDQDDWEHDWELTAANIEESSTGGNSGIVPTTAPLQTTARVQVCEVWENERRPFTRFSWAKHPGAIASGGFHYSTLLPTDRQRWSTVEGGPIASSSGSPAAMAASIRPDGIEIIGDTLPPPEGYRWMEKEWRVCVEPGRTDSQGWEYAFNWGRRFSAHAVMDGVAADFVRRRRWQRRAAKPLG